MIEEELLAFTPRPGVVDAVLVMPKPAPEIEPPVVKARTWLCGHCGRGTTMTTGSTQSQGRAVLSVRFTNSTRRLLGANGWAGS